MYDIFTDMARESADLRGELPEDCKSEDLEIRGLAVNRLTVSEKGEKLLGKPRGIYYSALFGRLWQLPKSSLFEAAKVIRDILNTVMPRGDGCVMVVCLGNGDITPDSVGPKASRHLLVTHHIRELNGSLYREAGFGDCCAVVPGVLCRTGFESAETVAALTEKIKPEGIIVIDALCSRHAERTAAAFQISTAGITPGSGVGNHRLAINGEAMGCPVVSLGFPTVVRASTLALDLLSGQGVSEEVLDEVGKKLSENCLFVAPKEMDTATDSLALLAARAVNMYLHPRVNPEDFGEYICP